MSETTSSFFPLTPLEENLKRCLALRPDISSRILTGQELEQYIGWMMRTFGRQAQDLALLSDVEGDSRGRMLELGRHILNDPSDRSSLKALSDIWGNQKEDAYIRPDQDLSAWKMLRYMPAHWHKNQYFEIFYSLSGDCPIHFQNEVVTMKPGSVLIVAPGVLHANPCYADDRILVYYMLRATTFDRVFWNQLPPGNLMSAFFRKALSGQQPNSCLLFETEGDEEIYRLMERIYDEYRQEEAYCNQMMLSCFSACLVLLLRRYEGTARLPRSEDFKWKHEFSAILSYIQTHFADMRITDLCDRFHYSERQITRIVQKYTGLSYVQLINKLRMEKAAQLILRGDLTIGRIAEMTGYSTVSSFYRCFVRYYGCTPVEYGKARAGK